jgi:hypothetical protein
MCKIGLVDFSHRLIIKLKRFESYIMLPPEGKKGVTGQKPYLLGPWFSYPQPVIY